jgi:phosphoribosylglycinamide formyltransferase-1
VSPRPVGVLISGRGSNLQALIDAQKEGGLGGEIAVVISNVEEAAGLERARRAGIPAHCCPHPGRSREDHDRELVAILRAHGVELVCLAGYMRLLSADFVRAFPERVLNVHPSLLPAFPGLDTHRRALACGARIHGCTVHFVTAALDQGPIVIQAAVPVLPDDTEARLAARVLREEHRIYPQAVRWFCEERLRLGTDDIVWLHAARTADGVLVSPPLEA